MVSVVRKDDAKKVPRVLQPPKTVGSAIDTAICLFDDKEFQAAATRIRTHVLRAGCAAAADDEFVGPS